MEGKSATTGDRNNEMIMENKNNNPIFQQKSRTTEKIKPINTCKKKDLSKVYSVRKPGIDCSHR